MKKYPKYKITGTEWIDGDASTSLSADKAGSAQGIPEEWEIKKIKHLCYVKGRVGWKGLKASEFLIKGFAYLVTGTDFKDGLVDWENCYQIDEERYLEDPYIQLRNDDLLITKDGTIGKLAIVENLDKPACLNSGIFVVRSLIDNFSTQYLYWILRSTIFSNYNNYTSYGSTIQHLYQNVFVEFNFCFPMYTEQTAIANYLDDKTAKIDTLIEKKKKLIELLKEERTSVINQAVTRGINPNVKLKDSGIDWLGDIPEHWDVKKLKYVGDIISGGAFSSTAFQKEGTVRAIKITNIQHDQLLLEDTEYLPKEYAETYSRFLIYYGDILFALTRPIISSGIKSTRVEVKNEIMLLNQRNAIFRVKDKECSDFFYYITHCLYFYQLFEVNMDTTGQQPNISTLDIANFIIAIPPEEEQIHIVKHIESETKRIDGIISKIEKEIELLAEYRAALISEVVTGKIKVC